jgi:hypothetical protein
MQSDKEKSAHEAYKKFLDIMLYDVPLEQLDELVESDLTGYGTTLDEKILEIERLRKLVIDQREQGAGYDINFVIHPVHRRMSSNENSAIFVDEIEITMSINGEKNVIPLRFSTVLEFIGGSWKVVHLHGSVAVNTEGDTWHKDEHRKKIEELQKLVSEKTADLITKSKELEIEASLERIRAIAMSMQKAEGLLDVVEILNTELKTLGFTDIRNTIINIFNDTKQKFLNYDYSDYGVGGISEVDYNSHPSNKKFVNKMREASKDFMVTEFTGHELDEWRKWRIDQGQMPDSKLDQAKSLYYYEFSIGVGSIGISTFSPINADQLKILSKIRNVFSLAYQRYSDIALAEAQAREAQIEASLERVRAVAMSMNKSDDLLSICEVSFNEFKKLGFNNLRNSLINIFNDEEESFVNYDYSDYLGGSISNDAYNSNPANEEFLIQIRKANDAFVETVIDRNQLDEWKEFRRSHGEKDDPRLENINALYYYNYSIGSGSIGISNFIPISKEQQVILKRFRNVFDLAYRRYNDIALAEAQAREAQIEASLERVRAVAMGMNKSDDLLSICEVSFKEFKKLGFDNIRNALIHIQYDEQKYFMDYDFSDLTGGAITKIEYGSHPVVEDYLHQIRSAKDAFYQGVIKEEQLEEWKNFRRNSGQIDDPRLEKATALYYYFFSIGIGDIGISTLQPIDESQIKILKRFRNVFDLAYRRYNDITIAEEQARETQIQLALERVRARTMAMHKSEELSQTSFVLFEQLKALGEVADQISIMIYNEKEKVIELYATIYGNQWNEIGRLPFEESLVHKKIYNAWKEKKKSLVVDLTGKELIDFNNFKMKYSKQYKSEDELPKNRWIVHNAFFSNGVLTFSTYEPRLPEILQLLERFAGVFDLTYTRFLDLQKAEAQARESQVEAALEKVRSRSLAMHKSEELNDVVMTLFGQMNNLEIDIDGININILKSRLPVYSLFQHPCNE